MAISTTAMLVISTAVQAIGAIAEGRDAKRQADFSAAVDRQRAEREREIAGQEEEDFRRKQRRVAAQSRAEGGARGVDSSTGSPLLAAEDFATEEELQALRIRAGGQSTAHRLNQQASLTSAAGKSAQTRGFTRAGSTLLTGFSTGFGANSTSTTKKKPKRITGTQSTVALNT